MLDAPSSKEFFHLSTAVLRAVVCVRTLYLVLGAGYLLKHILDCHWCLRFVRQTSNVYHAGLQADARDKMYITLGYISTLDYFPADRVLEGHALAGVEAYRCIWSYSHQFFRYR